ncbi:MAG: hypothetical protein IPN46_03445 [Saprospiraceae bacterium]|nr:hypothetical protein [Saprospiraceae bacterium]
MPITNVGIGVTFTVNVASSVQPLASVTTTLYVVHRYIVERRCRIRSATIGPYVATATRRIECTSSPEHIWLSPLILALDLDGL